MTRSRLGSLLPNQAPRHSAMRLQSSGRRRPLRKTAALVAALLASAFVWMLFYLQVVTVVGFLPLPTGYPRFILRRNWVRVRLSFQVAAEARRAAALPRYVPPPGAALPPVFVVSLRAAEARRASVAGQLEERGVAFRWWDAVDGAAALPEEEVRRYTSGARLAAYRASAPGGHAYRKAACDLSHLRLMHAMLGEGREVQVVLEDDAQLVDRGADFVARLNATLRALPEDWEVLWLNHGAPLLRNPRNLAGWVGAGVRAFRDNSDTIGLVYRRSFALTILSEAQIGNRDVDNLMNDVGQLGMARAYVADPPLVRIHEARFPSQIEEDADGGGITGRGRREAAAAR